MVMAQSLYRVLLAAAPDTRIEVVAPTATAPLAARMPEVAATHELSAGHGEFAFAQRRALGRQLRGQFDWAIVLPSSWKAALVPYFARVPRRSGFVGEFRYGLLNDVRQLDATRWPRLVQRFAALAQAVNATDAALPVPRLTTSPAAAAGWRQQLGLVARAPVLALCPGAEFGVAKRWPATHFAAIAQHYLRVGYQVWLLGGASDVAICDSILTAIQAAIPAMAAVTSTPPVVNLAGRTTLLGAVDLLSEAARVVSNDSGLMHIAAALNVPVVGVYGSSSAEFTPPLGARAAAVSLALACSPCFARTCRYGHYDCLNKLVPDRVLGALCGIAGPA